MRKLINQNFFPLYGIIIIFIIDLMIPPGTAVAILYIVPVTMSYTLSKRTTVIYAIIATALTMVDTALSYNVLMLKTTLFYIVTSDRILAILAIWTSNFIVFKIKGERIKKDAQRETYLKNISEMIFKVSHEVRSPLCRMQAITNLVECKYIQMEDLEKVCCSLKDSIDELDTFTKRLGEFLDKVRVENILDD